MLWPHTILIVEDDPVFQTVLTELIQADWPAATVIYTAQTLAEALAILGEHTIDLVIVDLCLPDASELEAPLVLQRALPMGHNPLPIVIVTGLPNGTWPTRALAMDVEYVQKSDPSLRQAFNSATKRAWARHQFIERRIAHLRFIERRIAHLWDHQ